MPTDDAPFCIICPTGVRWRGCTTRAISHSVRSGALRAACRIEGAGRRRRARTRGHVGSIAARQARQPGQDRARRSVAPVRRRAADGGRPTRHRPHHPRDDRRRRRGLRGHRARRRRSREPRPRPSMRRWSSCRPMRRWSKSKKRSSPFSWIATARSVFARRKSTNACWRRWSRITGPSCWLKSSTK